MYARTIPLALTLALTTACFEQGPSADDFRNALPDDRILVDMPAADASERGVGELSDYYVLTAKVTEDVNHLIGGVVLVVDLVTMLPPTWADETHEKATWGPWNDGPLDPNETLLWVEHHAEDDSYTWAIAKRAKGSAEEVEWTPIIAGEVDPGGTDTTGSGRFAIDFDALHAMDPTEFAQGLFVSEYDVDGERVIASAILEDFAETQDAPTGDAGYAYEQVVGGEGTMDLAIVANVDETPSSADETLVIRSRWQQDGAGRSDAVLTNGDLGSLVITASDCWDTSFETVYYSDNYGPAEEGDPAACVFEEASFSEEDPTS